MHTRVIFGHLQRVNNIRTKCFVNSGHIMLPGCVIVHALTSSATAKQTGIGNCLVRCVSNILRRQKWKRQHEIVDFMNKMAPVRNNPNQL